MELKSRGVLRWNNTNTSDERSRDKEKVGWKGSPGGRS